MAVAAVIVTTTANWLAAARAPRVVLILAFYFF